MKGYWRALIVASACAVGCAAACGSPLNTAGMGCTVDADCAAGLSCLPLASAPGAGCRTLLDACSKACKTDADCVAVATDFKCVPTCDGGGTCGKTR